MKVLIDRIFRLSQAFPGVFRCFLGTRTTTPEARVNVPALRRTQRACEAVSGRPPRRSALMSFGLVHEDDRAEDNRVGRLVRVRDEAGCWREGLTASSIDERGGRRLYFVCLGTFASVSEAMEHFHALESHGGVVPCMDRAVDLPGLEEKGHVLYVDGMQHPAFSQSSVDDIVHHNYAHIHERGCERVLELRCKIRESVRRRLLVAIVESIRSSPVYSILPDVTSRHKLDQVCVRALRSTRDMSSSLNVVEGWALRAREIARDFRDIAVASRGYEVDVALFHVELAFAKAWILRTHGSVGAARNTGNPTWIRQATALSRFDANVRDAVRRYLVRLDSSR